MKIIGKIEKTDNGTTFLVQQRGVYGLLHLGKETEFTDSQEVQLEIAAPCQAPHQTPHLATRYSPLFQPEPPLIDDIAYAVLAVVSPEGYDPEDLAGVREAVSNTLAHNQTKP